jgi:predicted nucleic acid-binding protein
VFVVDASITLAWCFTDEATEKSQALLRRVIDDGCMAPGIWPIECANILIAAERTGRVSAADLKENIAKLQSLDVEVDDEMPARSFTDILHLARQHRLTSYDAAYLELALRRKLPLATKDKQLQETARRAGVALIDV